jgi:hypothetical protein
MIAKLSLDWRANNCIGDSSLHVLGGNSCNSKVSDLHSANHGRTNEIL